MKALIEFIKENIEIIEENPFVFLVGGIICFSLGVGFQMWLNGVGEKWKKKYKKLLESYRSLENDYNELKEEFLKDDLRVLTVGEKKHASVLASKMSQAIKEEKYIV